MRQDFIDQINLDLNRPVVNPLILPPLTVSDFNNDFNFDDSMHAWSLMLNGLLDFGGQDGVGGYVGGGAGYANVHAFDQSKGKFAWQLLAGVYYPVSGNVDIGLKARYFATGNVRQRN